jgi:hypothetical protein
MTPPEETHMMDNQPRPDAAPSATTEPAAAAASRGVRALAGVAVAIVGVVAAANPNSAVLRALNQAMPQLADAIPTLITACGAVLAAFSQPPKLLRRKRSTTRSHVKGAAAHSARCPPAR